MILCCIITFFELYTCSETPNTSGSLYTLSEFLSVYYTNFAQINHSFEISPNPTACEYNRKYVFDTIHGILVQIEGSSFDLTKKNYICVEISTPNQSSFDYQEIWFTSDLPFKELLLLVSDKFKIENYACQDLTNFVIQMEDSNECSCVLCSIELKILYKESYFGLVIKQYEKKSSFTNNPVVEVPKHPSISKKIK